MFSISNSDFYILELHLFQRTTFQSAQPTYKGVKIKDAQIRVKRFIIKSFSYNSMLKQVLQDYSGMGCGGWRTVRVITDV